MMAPLLTAALNSVPQKEIPMASSFLNVAQNVGGAVGIALMNNMVTNAVQRSAVRLGEALPLPSQGVTRLIGHAGGVVTYRTPGMLVTDQTKASFVAAQTIMHRAQVLGFEHGFVIAGVIILAALPLSLMLKPTARQGRPRRATVPAGGD